jgi:hypothetical protein
MSAHAGASVPAGPLASSADTSGSPRAAQECRQSMHAKPAPARTKKAPATRSSLADPECNRAKLLRGCFVERKQVMTVSSSVP